MGPTAERYADATGRLQGALTFGINPSLDGIRALTDALGRPQSAFRSIQVTGTNGKTSVVRMTGALLSANGRRTGVYTSPHLVSYTERIAIDGTAVTEDELAAALETVFEAADGLGGMFTEFELLTAAALVVFRDRGVEWAVLEVGMGGRWDATSVVDPAVAVITGVALDHTERLGSTREEIAADKAHIIKPGSIPIVGPGCDGVAGVFLDRALETGHSGIFRVGRGPDADITWEIVGHPDRPGGLLTLDVRGVRDYRLSLRAPSYQAPNIATAMTAASAALFDVQDPEVASRALGQMRFPGRFEVLRQEPPLIIDGAHNPDAAAMLADAIAEAFADALPIVVLGILADKDAEGIVRALAPVAFGFVCTQNGSPRALSPDALAGTVATVTGTLPETAPDVAAAVARAEAVAPGRGVVVTGSLYTAGEARRLFGPRD